MDIKEIKQYIYENNKIELVLQELGMHHIKWHNNNSYITCGMPDGDNPQSTVIYNNEALNVVAYTRDIVDAHGISDIISLACFINKNMTFTQAIDWICNLVGLETSKYYVQEKQETIEDLLQELKKLYLKYDDTDVPLQPLDEIVLREFKSRFTHEEFVKDNISPETQREFEIGFSLRTDYYGFPRHRITIPIRDEQGTLVGVKGRLPKNVYYWSKCVDEEREKEEPKYIYLYPCAKAKILYGLYKTQPYIKEQDEVIVCEAEKGVMQLWTYGFKNSVGIGGHEISATQLKKLLDLNANVVIAFDKDISKEQITKECKKFKHSKKKVYYIYDIDDILEDKESPMDNLSKWEKLYKKKKQYLFEKKDI